MMRIFVVLIGIGSNNTFRTITIKEVVIVSHIKMTIIKLGKFNSFQVEAMYRFIASTIFKVLEIMRLFILFLEIKKNRIINTETKKVQRIQKIK